MTSCASSCAERQLARSRGLVKSSGDHKALLPVKLNQARIDRMLHNFSGLAFTGGAVNGRDKATKRQRLVFVLIFHSTKIDGQTVRRYGGLPLTRGFMNPPTIVMSDIR